ncbi:MFS transporter [Prosthecobacter sp.]|uniref:MFS transporter n=1 Tax=Prosthecobacter sp. TaxID=1965333 RepID=UPI0037C689A9
MSELKHSSFTTPSVWTQVVAGALLMLATLPGRSHGLGLVTEPLLKELQLSRDTFAQINLWATLGGALVCLPVGAWLDRCGLKTGALVLLPALALVVLVMSGMHVAAMGLFVLVLLTRALGQGAMSVLSLAVAGRAFRHNSGAAAGAYAVLMSVLFMLSFYVVGKLVHDSGWRVAWRDIGIGLLVVMPVAFWLRNTSAEKQVEAGTDADLTLAQCVRIPAFWAYSAGISAFAAISTATGLFNQALLAERGFDQEAAYHFLAGSAIIALLGQMICGAGLRWRPIRFWLGGALFIQAAALAAYKFIQSSAGMWTLAALMGISGGIITVAFFAIWGDSFGKRHLGRIQGVAQMCTVLASALGPLLLERGAGFLHGYANTLMIAAPMCVLLGLLVLILRPLPPAA